MERNPFYNTRHDAAQDTFASDAPYGNYQQPQGQSPAGFAQAKNNPFDNGMQQGYPNMGQMPLQPQPQPQPHAFAPPVAPQYQQPLAPQQTSGYPMNDFALPSQPLHYNGQQQQQQGTMGYVNEFDPFNMNNGSTMPQQPVHRSSNSGFLNANGGFAPVTSGAGQNSAVEDDLLMFDPLAEEERRKRKAEASRQAMILDRASALCRQGLISESDERLLKELLTSGDKELENKLIYGMKDGNIDNLKQYLRLHRQRFGIQEETEARRDSTDSEGTITDGDDQNKSLYSELVAAQVEHDRYACPHPKAGGFKETVPESMYIVDGKFVGTILMRVSSKKLFRKWKPVFFVLDKKLVKFYDTARLWELKSEPREIYEIHPLMQICKPTLKRTYSVMDDGRRVYYCVFRENPPESAYGPSGIKVNKFSRALESRRICKFGAYTMQEVSAFAHALHGVVGYCQKRTQIPVTSAYP